MTGTITCIPCARTLHMEIHISFSRQQDADRKGDSGVVLIPLTDEVFQEAKDKPEI
jgi:hypothetical protein